MRIAFSVFCGTSTRLDHYISTLFGHPRSHIKSMIQQGDITVEGVRQKPSYAVQRGNGIEMLIHPPSTAPLPDAVHYTESCIQTDQWAIPVLYRDDDILIINKPPGLLVHAAVGNPNDNLVSILKRAHIPLHNITSDRAGVVHRLDQYTEGVMLLALSEDAYTDCVAQFKARTVTKKYYAVVKGVPRADHATIQFPIGRDASVRIKQSCHHYIPGTEKTAITTYHVLWASTNIAVLDVAIHTGRTHQIRVHLATIQCPVLGDSLYSRQPQKKDGYFLQSYHLTIQHPRHQTPLTIQIPISLRLKKYRSNHQQ